MGKAKLDETSTVSGSSEAPRSCIMLPSMLLVILIIPDIYWVLTMCQYWFKCFTGTNSFLSHLPTEPPYDSAIPLYARVNIEILQRDRLFWGFFKELTRFTVFWKECPAVQFIAANLEAGKKSIKGAVMDPASPAGWRGGLGCGNRRQRYNLWQHVGPGLLGTEKIRKFRKGTGEREQTISRSHLTTVNGRVDSFSGYVREAFTLPYSKPMGEGGLPSTQDHCLTPIELKLPTLLLLLSAFS